MSRNKRRIASYKKEEISENKSEKKPFERRIVRAITDGQRHYLKTILDKEITICEGLAGTGKTHIAIGTAIWQFNQRKYKRIVIARPAVEADEEIGFLPGDIDAKLDPFMRPILDELINFVSYSELEQLKNSKALEICPVGMMRGRTFKDTFVVCDECQNVTFKQMKMLLTRLGTGSRMVLTGDITQSDLETRHQGGFQYAYDLFERDPDVGTIQLGQDDVVRNKIVGKIIEKWDKHIDKYKETGNIKSDEDAISEIAHNWRTVK